MKVADDGCWISVEVNLLPEQHPRASVARIQFRVTGDPRSHRGRASGCPSKKSLCRPKDAGLMESHSESGMQRSILVRDRRLVGIQFCTRSRDRAPSSFATHSPQFRTNPQHAENFKEVRGSAVLPCRITPTVVRVIADFRGRRPRPKITEPRGWSGMAHMLDHPCAGGVSRVTRQSRHDDLIGVVADVGTAAILSQSQGGATLLPAVH